jgi:DJ-1 family protein
MKKIFLFLANGFEEIEAIATVDVLRRGEIGVTTVSISDKKEVTGAHNVTVLADVLFNETNFNEGDMLVLPGGMPGASNLNEHEGLKQLLLKYNAEGKLITAICAAPLVLGGLGLLKDKRATCYPSFEPTLTGATHVEDGVVVDGNITTGKGPGFTIDFALTLVQQLQGKGMADEVAGGMLYKS